MRPLHLIPLLALSLPACSPDSGSSLRDIPMTYRFENVRTTTTTDEMAGLRAVLDKHSTAPADIQTTNSRTVEGSQVRTITAAVILPTLAEIDAMQADLEQFAASMTAADRPEWTLVGMTAHYRSNFVAAGITTTISGFATAGYTVRVYVNPGDEPTELRANSSGLWTAKLSGLPTSGWVYGVATDPKGRDKPAHFRVNTATRRQERADPAEFERLFGANAKPAASLPAQPAQSPSASRDAAEAAARRKAEDEALRKKREAEAQRR